MNIFKLIYKFCLSRNKLRDISRYFNLPYVLSYPTSASIELTNNCNLNCYVCEGRTLSVREKGSMKHAEFHKILTEIGPHLNDLELSGWGEPFMNSDIYAMFKSARELAPNAYIYLDTNGHNIDPDQLFISPPDEIVFSVDGLDQKTYETYRIGGNLYEVIENLKNCVAIKRKLLTKKPKIVFKFICMRHNEHQLTDIPNFARDVGADDYRIELFTSRSVDHALRFMSTKSEYQKYDVDKLKDGCIVPFMKQLVTPCPMLWGHASIYWNGDVSPCCLDYDGKYTWGNIFQAGNFWRVWNSKKAESFRRSHKKPTYRSTISLCKNCYLTNCEMDQEAIKRSDLSRAGRFHNFEHKAHE